MIPVGWVDARQPNINVGQRCAYDRSAAFVRRSVWITIKRSAANQVLPYTVAFNVSFSTIFEEINLCPHHRTKLP